MLFPYATSANAYLNSGVGHPIPSAFPFEKMPPLKGWTGKKGGVPSPDQVDEWRAQYPMSNILLRVMPNVVGIDVDAYGKKQGKDTLHRVSKRHGALPLTYKSSARGRGPAGIYFFRLHSDMDESKLKGDFGPHSDIEVVRFSHRYAVVAPSWHQGAGAEYAWWIGDIPTGIPSFVDLPFLPQQWYGHMIQQCSCFEQQRAERRAQIQRYKNRTNSSADTELAEMDFERGINRLASLPEGGRNNELSKLAGRTLFFDVFVNGALDLEFVLDRLHLAADTCGLDETETERTIESAHQWATDMAAKDEM